MKIAISIPAGMTDKEIAFSLSVSPYARIESSNPPRSASALVSNILRPMTAWRRIRRNGGLATGQTRCAAASFRPWQPVHQRAIPEADGRSRRRLFDEPFGQRLGQCRDGELLLVVEDRAHRAQNVPDPRPSKS